MKDTLTKRETYAVKLAALLEIIGERVSPTALYLLSSDKSAADFAAMKQAAPVATRWIQSKRISEPIQKEKALYSQKLEALFATTPAQGNEAGAGAAGIDYSNPVNAVRKLNDIIRTSKDTGEQLDALKVLIGKKEELAQGAEEESKKTRPQTRFFLPMTCDQCPLYLNAKDNSK